MSDPVPILSDAEFVAASESLVSVDEEEATVHIHMRKLCRVVATLAAKIVALEKTIQDLQDRDIFRIDY